MPYLVNRRGRTVSVHEELVPRLLARGFTPAPVSDAPNLESFTIVELRQYASENDIDLRDATRKADILAIVRG